ncbi:hypothetical protein P3T76_009582 [Phytophthora citrophthora]|uniref:Sulfatase N-terminal domain-containing protein n=1 Tax=Phytophthora citrophthora TaxID=4793 RepID=A0AAD9GG95_9STRA|nr:hypothetical protein P3T76_009582 [Phytophthora citrophthora]
MYATSKYGTPGVIAAALVLGVLEDFVCTTYLACALWAVNSFSRWFNDKASRVVTFIASWLLFVATMIPFVVDLLLVRLRGMRFTFALVQMMIDEKDHANAVAVSSTEIQVASLGMMEFVVVATFFAIVRTWASWADLSVWNPTHLVLPSTASQVYNARIEIEEKGSLALRPMSKKVFFKRSIIVFVALVLNPLLVVGLSRASSPLVAYSALNTTLNELFGHALEPSLDLSQAVLSVVETSVENPNNLRVGKNPAKKSVLPWVEAFIDYNTEEHTLVGENTLTRLTTGFKGDLAFDVNVSDADPPNVLVLVVESFRYHDSHYLVGSEDPMNFFKGNDMTITPNFDKWAKRNIGLRNFWSSWRTSRSLESLMFGQLPYDSATKSGTTGGQQHTKLSGLPQFFSKKGYETFFSTGTRVDYDGWSEFLPTHGFDTVWGINEMVYRAENHYGIKRHQWAGEEHRGMNWGLHGDLSFQILGDLMIQKTNEQAKRVAKGEPKKPLFLNHYTISSHVTYKQRPKWYDEAEKPDFSALYEGEMYADNIKNYLEMRYFTDLEMGKFLDRMEKAGILNDTIIVIAGDHGQGPEFGNDIPEDRDVSATRVAGAIIAEGRLGEAAGMIIDDATEQYDILNTLADISGVPVGGFLQHGIGRSLKRKIKFGERAVYSNNPTRKMSVVRGHLRLRYDRMTDYVLLHDVDTDHDMKNDLLPSLSEEERLEWLNWRDKGRLLNVYNTRRWESQCFLEQEC